MQRCAANVLENVHARNILVSGRFGGPHVNMNVRSIV